MARERGELDSDQCGPVILFVYLRLYGPEQAYFDQTYQMNGIEKIK